MLQNLSVADILTDKGWWGLETSRPPPQGRGSVATHGGALGGLAKIVTGHCASTQGSVASELELQYQEGKSSDLL